MRLPADRSNSTLAGAVLFISPTLLLPLSRPLAPLGGVPDLTSKVGHPRQRRRRWWQDCRRRRSPFPLTTTIAILLLPTPRRFLPPPAVPIVRSPGGGDQPLQKEQVVFNPSQERKKRETSSSPSFNFPLLLLSPWLHPLPPPLPPRLSSSPRPATCSLPPNRVFPTIGRSRAAIAAAARC
uniref:Uncharacterized protein n=1 Tax=Oryza glumipatula TaxID=40148 RepID=A0A0D9YM57_9ORYZ